MNSALALAAPERAATGAWCAPLTASRWHLQHGPIDVVLGLEGEAAGVQAALSRVRARFEGLLGELVGELPGLRAPLHTRPVLHGPVARRMRAACAPYADEHFITSMAAVAGAVAQELVGAACGPGLRRVWANNGGDVALWLARGESLSLAVCANPRVPTAPSAWPAQVRIDSDSPVRGVATSGWSGRSFSRGVADAVTVLAETAAQADAAATILANAVDVDHPAVERAPACSLRDDSDLGDLPVTVQVGALPPECLEEALDRGARLARTLCQRGWIHQALLSCQGRSRIVNS